VTEMLRIERLGAAGDGMARTPAGPVFVPFTLPGELVEAERLGDRAGVEAVLEPSSARVAPSCRHFGVCGACSLQHMEEKAYRAWKRLRVVEALAAEGIEAEVAPLVPCALRARRRVTLAARRTEAGTLLGFNRMHSHEIVDISENWIALPAIVSALPALRDLATRIARTPKPFRLVVTATDSGLDVAGEGSGRLADADRRAAAAFAVRAGFARLSLDGETVLEPRKPVVAFGTVTVAPPPGAFLQAVAETESAMAALVAQHFTRAKRVADLFAGCGAFALRLASGAAVHAVETDAGALAALDFAARHATGLRPVTTERRDLFRRPLTARELDRFDAVSFDPPRAGAEAQARELAKSAVPRVAAVSCNPVTLARDLKLLIAGGYRLAGITPLDQFLWSGHVEAVALLERRDRR
jgi:23S rRNA (uracil1939-C5)-methyltransferase